jgi:hypothetical protein
MHILNWGINKIKIAKVIHMTDAGYEQCALRLLVRYIIMQGNLISTHARTSLRLFQDSASNFCESIFAEARRSLRYKFEFQAVRILKCCMRVAQTICDVCGRNLIIFAKSLHEGREVCALQTLFRRGKGQMREREREERRKLFMPAPRKTLRGNKI